MAERRMLTKKVTDDDNFMSLSSSAQALYLHLSMSADDDGFSNQVAISMFKAHASVQDLQALLEKRYIYQFDSGVIVIKHWRMANALRKDRYTPTAFQEELAKLDIKDNGSYTWLPDGCQVVARRLPQDRIGKDSIEEESIEEDRTEENSKGKKETYISVIESYTSCTSLQSALRDYVEMRKKTKGFTVRALKLNLNTLDKLASDDDEKLEIVNKSVEHSWKGFYELKADEKKSLRTKKTPIQSETPKESPVETILNRYDALVKMFKLYPEENTKKAIENVKAMYRDLTGKDIEDE